MINSTQQIIICILSILSIFGIAYLLCVHLKRIHILKLITLSLSFSIIGYVIATVPFFWMDTFSAFKAVLTEFLLVSAASIFVFFRTKKAEKNIKEKIDFDIRKCIIPLCIAALALAMSWSNFGFFGMGQDQGVYQVKAINLMYGETNRVYHFDEYDGLETEGEKESYLNWINGRLEGLYTTAQRGSTDRILSWISGPAGAYDKSDGIFHGIPTYPALLALWGLIFGMQNMAGVQTLIYALTGLVIWYITENFKLQKISSVFACTVFILSPEVLWISKSTLTEGLMALIISLFVLILSSEETEKRWHSAWMVTAFSVVHVSIYAMIPMFIVLFYMLFFKTEQKQYLRAVRISCVSFIVGYTFMVYASPSYTLGNSQSICRGPISLNNVYYILMAFTLIVGIVTFFVGRVHIKWKIGAIIESKVFRWICRVFIASMLFISALSIMTGASDEGLMHSIRISSIYNMIWMTGLVSFPVLIITLLIKPQKLMKNEIELAILFIFFYAVLIFSAVMMRRIKYCYYYGRYLTPYIPIVCIASALIWNQILKKWTVLALLVTTVAMLPYTKTIINKKDDTNLKYETLQKFADKISPDSSAVIFDGEVPRVFLLPVRAMTKADCYFPIYDSLDSQAVMLKKQYDHVYCITDTLNWKELASSDEEIWLDDNASYRTGYCPFPYEIKSENVIHYSLYEYDVD